jgi:acyl dehydratase
MLETVMRDLNIGDEVVRLTKPPISKEQLVRYAGASGDFNPLHTDDETARKAGFDGVVAHGMLIMGFLTQAATTWMPKRFLKKINVRFKAVTRAGDTITVTMMVTE